MDLTAVATSESRSREELTADLTDLTTKPAQTVQLGRWLGLLTADLELSDYGMALRWLAANRDEAPSQSPALSSPGLTELVLWLFLRSDSLLLALMVEWVNQSQAGPPRLEGAVERLLAGARAEADPDQLVPAPELRDSLNALVTVPDRLNPAVEVRLEILASLGLVQPVDEDSPNPLPDQRLRSLLAALDRSLLTTDNIGAFLDRRYFSGMLPTRLRAGADPGAADRILLWLARAYSAIQRPLGFTPGRPVSLLACCLAARAGTAVEIQDAYQCIYEAAGSRWAEFLHFSGGSRFDREFLIRIEPAISGLLESEVASKPASS